MKITISHMPELLVLDTGARAVRRAAVLARESYVISTATVAAAEEMLRDRRIDVIVTCYRCDDGTALEVCRLATTLEPAPAVLVTGPEMPHVPGLIAAGSQGILLNPIDADRLRRVVRDILRARAGQEGAHTAVGRPQRAMIQYHRGIGCPTCTTRGVHSFAPASHGRACTRAQCASWCG